MAEGMKALPATYRFTHNASGASFSADCVPCSNSTADLDAASKGWDLMFKYHGRPSGAFGADEMLSGLAAARGSVRIFASPLRITHDPLQFRVVSRGGEYSTLDDMAGLTRL